jgi:class 3 adenylate cyclase
MRKSIQLRWIEHAEARLVRERAGLQRAASEPPVNIDYTANGSALFHSPRTLARALGRAVAAVRSLSDERGRWATAARRSAVRTSPTKVDHDRILLAILITDIVDSTKWAAEVGDHDWRVLLGRHHNATRNQIKLFGGREVGNRGDGFVGIFDSPSRAVLCASAIADTIAPLGILLRSGVHAGEVHLTGGEISGIAVHIAARIAATAHPGEARVSQTVRDLVAGSGLVFEYRGIHRLRGVPEEIHLYAMPQLSASTNASVVGLEIGRVHVLRTVTTPPHRDLCDAKHSGQSLNGCFGTQPADLSAAEL